MNFLKIIQTISHCHHFLYSFFSIEMSLRGRPACTKYFRSYINIGAIYSHGNHTVLDWEYDDVTNLTVTYTIVRLPVPLLFSAIIHNTSEFWKHICNTRSASDWVTSIVVKYTGVGTHVPRWLASCIWEHFLWFMSSPSCRTGLLMQIEFAHDWNYFAFGCLFNVAMCMFPFFGYFFFRLRHANCFGMVVFFTNHFLCQSSHTIFLAVYSSVPWWPWFQCVVTFT